MSEDVVTRLGNVIMGVRHSTYMSTQGRSKPAMDGWVGREAYVQFLHDAKPMLLHQVTPRMVAGEFKFMGVKFKRDMDMEPRSMIICMGGVPVRRVALDFPEYDKTPVVDHPDAMALEIMALRYFERGEHILKPGVGEPTIDIINRLPKHNHEQPKMHSVSLDRLAELGLIFKEQRGKNTVVGLTLMGREALRQFEAARDA